MRRFSLPAVTGVPETGASDPIYDTLLLSGPAVVVLIGLVGRTPVGRAIAGAYLLVFVANVLHTFGGER